MERRSLSAASHDDVVDDLPAYVLGVLDPDSAEVVAEHLARCPLCQEERRRLEETLGLLGSAPPQADPSPELRDRFLAGLDDALPPARQSAADEANLPEPTPIRAGIPGWVRLALVAAAVLIIGLGIGAGLLASNLSQTNDEVTAMRQQRATATELLTDPAQSIRLVADNQSSAYGMLYVGRHQPNEAMLMVDKLQPTPAGRVYQIWLMQGGTGVNAGVFTVGTSGRATVMIRAPEALSRYQRMGITEETGPHGNTAPTGPRVIGCSLSS